MEEEKPRYISRTDEGLLKALIAITVFLVIGGIVLVGLL